MRAMRALVSHLQIVAAVLVAMLAMGRGLPGIVSAVVDSPSHVCTCASGGDHASCPVCNRSLLEQPASASSHVEAKGVPCGRAHGVGAMADGEVVILPAAAAVVRPLLASGEAIPSRYVSILQLSLEPATPPPRVAST
jgi:hypothetical protein